MPPSRAKRGSSYTQVELDSFLDLMEEILPLSSQEWERVETLHRVNFPNEDHTRESLKRKFQELYRTKIPTGDPNIPPHIKRAKEIQRKREARTNSSDCEGEEDIEKIAKEKETETESKGEDTDSHFTIESGSTPLKQSAKPLVKVPLPLAARKRPKLENEDKINGLNEMFKAYMQQKLEQRKQDEERRERERQEKEEEKKQKEEEKREKERYRRDRDLAFNQMIMTLLTNAKTGETAVQTSNKDKKIRIHQEPMMRMKS